MSRFSTRGPAVSSFGITDVSNPSSRHGSPTRLNSVLGDSASFYQGRSQPYPKGLNVSASASQLSLLNGDRSVAHNGSFTRHPQSRGGVVAEARKNSPPSRPQPAASSSLSLRSEMPTQQPSPYGPELTSYEELVKRIAGLSTRLTSIEQREAEGLNTANRTLTSISDNVGRLGTIIANLEVKLGKDMAFLEEDIERQLKAEELARGEMERALHRTIKDELEALRHLARTGEGFGDSGSSSSPLAIAAGPSPLGSAGGGLMSKGSPLTSTTAKSIELKELTLKLNMLADSIDDRAEAIKRQIEVATADMQSGVQGVLSAVDMHRKHRDTSERALVEMIEDTCVALRQELEEEKRQRAESHRQLERVLLEAASRQWSKA